MSDNIEPISQHPCPNTQLLWYRKDRVETPPATWDAMIEQAEQIGEGGRIQAQGARLPSRATRSIRT